MNRRNRGLKQITQIVTKNMKVVSHNSGTGERPANMFARLFPFVARCQNKDILDQYKIGVRGFDIRIRWHKDGYYVHHGLARYRKTFEQVIQELNNVNRYCKDFCFVMVTYEWKLEEDEQYEFVGYVKEVMRKANFLTLGHVSMKKPEWKVLWSSKEQPRYADNYAKFTKWSLLPFPKLWWWIGRDSTLKCRELNEERGEWVMEDFV